MPIDLSEECQCRGGEPLRSATRRSDAARSGAAERYAEAPTALDELVLPTFSTAIRRSGFVSKSAMLQAREFAVT